MYIRTLRKELHKLKKEENKWKEVKVIQLKIQGERKKKSIKKIGKARKSFLESRVQRDGEPTSAKNIDFAREKTFRVLVKKTSHRSLF